MLRRHEIEARDQDRKALAAAIEEFEAKGRRVEVIGGPQRTEALLPGLTPDRVEAFRSMLHGSKRAQARRRARKLREDGHSDEQIAEALGLTMDELTVLRKPPAYGRKAQ